MKRLARPRSVSVSDTATIAMNKPDMLTRVIQTTVVREDEQDLGDALGDALTSTDI